jgi:hypothetical protein
LELLWASHKKDETAGQSDDARAQRSRMKLSFRQTLADSHVTAVAILVLLFGHLIG